MVQNAVSGLPNARPSSQRCDRTEQAGRWDDSASNYATSATPSSSTRTQVLKAEIASNLAAHARSAALEEQPQGRLAVRNPDKGHHPHNQ